MNSAAVPADTSLHFTPEALQWCQLLPKIELHAHLNGSVRDETLRQLVAEKGSACGVSVQALDDITSKRQRTLEDCFKLFAHIHTCTTDLDSICRITQEVIHDFANDNVVCLELRTSPKSRPEAGIAKAGYTAAVLEGIRRGVAREQAAGRWMLVRLLLSIDRREGPQAALETVQLAASLQRDGVVVGIDLSGNPRLGEWSLWEAALCAARDAGLAVTLHAGEVPAPQEVAAMVEFRPGRLGHMCCLTQEGEQQLLASRIPVELCLTSNVLTTTYNGYPDHHFRGLHAAGHPVVLCTDDSGVFGTTLSREYAIAMCVFGLTDAQMRELVRQSVDYAFVTDADRARLREQVEATLATVPPFVGQGS